MFLPSLSYYLRFKKSLSPQPSRPHEILCPIAQWPAQPFGNRGAKASFGTVHQSARDVLIENLSQQPLASISPLIERRRKAPGEFNDPMVQQRDARFQADRHGGPIHF